MVQTPVPRDARNLMDRLLCDVDDRLGSNGVQELKVHQQTESIHGCTLHVCSRISKYDTDTAITLLFLYSWFVCIYGGYVCLWGLIDKTWTVDVALPRL